MKFFLLIGFSVCVIVAVGLSMGTQNMQFSKDAVKKVEQISAFVDSAVAEKTPRDLKQCEYVLVTTKPFLCARGELILVAATKADKYCSDDGFARRYDDQIYCQFNGVDSRLKH